MNDFPFDFNTTNSAAHGNRPQCYYVLLVPSHCKVESLSEPCQCVPARTNTRTTTTITVSLEAGVEYAFGGRWSEPEYTVEFQRADDRALLVTQRVAGIKGSY